MANTVNKFLILTTHYVTKLSWLQFEAAVFVGHLLPVPGSSRYSGSIGSVSTIPNPTVHRFNVIPKRYDTGSELAKYAIVWAFCTKYSPVPQPSRLNNIEFNKPWDLTQDSQAAILIYFPLRPHLWALLALQSPLQLFNSATAAQTGNRQYINRT